MFKALAISLVLVVGNPNVGTTTEKLDNAEEKILARIQNKKTLETAGQEISKMSLDELDSLAQFTIDCHSFSAFKKQRDESSSQCSRSRDTYYLKYAQRNANDRFKREIEYLLNDISLYAMTINSEINLKYGVVYNVYQQLKFAINRRYHVLRKK
jgi:hypothetical protein